MVLLRRFHQHITGTHISTKYRAHSLLRWGDIQRLLIGGRFSLGKAAHVTSNTITCSLVTVSGPWRGQNPCDLLARSTYSYYRFIFIHFPILGWSGLGFRPSCARCEKYTPSGQPWVLSSEQSWIGLNPLEEPKSDVRVVCPCILRSIRAKRRYVLGDWVSTNNVKMLVTFDMSTGICFTRSNAWVNVKISVW